MNGGRRLKAGKLLGRRFWCCMSMKMLDGPDGPILIKAYGELILCCCPPCFALYRFGLAKEELKDVDVLLEEVTKKVHQLKPQGQSRPPGMPLVSLLGLPTESSHCCRSSLSLLESVDAPCILCSSIHSSVIASLLERVNKLGRQGF